MGKLETLTVGDVSERRRHRIQQLEQYQLLESVLGQAPDAIVVYDVQGKLLYLNWAARDLDFDGSADPDWIAAFRPVWLPGQPGGDGQGFPRPAAGRFRRALTASGAEVFEARGRRDGRTVELLVSAAALRDRQEKTIGATAVLSDVSRLKHVGERLRTLTAYLQILWQAYRERLDGEGAQMMEAALAQAGRMRRLIDDLLSYSRVGKGQGAAGGDRRTGWCVAA